MATPLRSGVAPVLPGNPNDAHVRKHSRRRERSTAQLHTAMSQVNDQLSFAPSIKAPSSAGSNPAEPSSPASIGRRKQQVRTESLRFPRVANQQETSSEDSPQQNAFAASSGNSTSATGSGKLDPEVSEQLEDLRLQNAVLRKSLATLQQSVVDSMKGDKAQFMGNGIFKKQTRPVGIMPIKAVASPSPPHAGANTAAEDADLENLRAALADRRAALKSTVAQRDEALEEAKAARRDLAAAEEANKELEARLREASERLEATGAERERLDAAQAAAAMNSAALSEELAELTRQMASLKDALDVSKFEASAAATDAAGLRQELEESQAEIAAAQARFEALSSEHGHAKRCLESQGSELSMAIVGLESVVKTQNDRLERMSAQLRARAQKVLCALGGRSALQRLCFEAWCASSASVREGRLSERVDELESSILRISEEAAAAKAAGEAAFAEAMASASAAAAARDAAQEATTALGAAQAEAERWKQRASEVEAQANALDEEVKRLRRAAGQAKEGETSTAEALRETEARVEQLQSELDVARESAKKAAAAAQSQYSEAVAREATLKKQAEAAAKSLAKAKEAEALAAKQRDEARAQAADAEKQHKQVLASLESSRADAKKSATDAQEARGRAEKAEKKTQELMSEVSALQKKFADRDAQDAAKSKSDTSLAQEHSKLKDEASSLRASLNDARATADANAAAAAEVASMKLALAEARSDAKASMEKIKLLREEKSAAAKALEGEKASKSEADRLAEDRAKFKEDAHKALEQAKSHIRLMVTAPKVAINIGNNERSIHCSFPFEAIRDAIQRDVVPKYSQVVEVLESIGDGEIKKDVDKMVESLALTLQSKVCELMPQAEGTTNWDGFGAKTGGLASSKYK